MRELAFERAQQVVDFFVVDEQVAVARDAELVQPSTSMPANSLCDERVQMPTRAGRIACRPVDCGQRTMRGSERGACTMASPVSRPNASLPRAAR